MDMIFTNPLLIHGGNRQLDIFLGFYRKFETRDGWKVDAHKYDR